MSAVAAGIFMKRGNTVCPGRQTCRGAGLIPRAAIISRTASARTRKESPDAEPASRGSRSATA